MVRWLNWIVFGYLIPFELVFDPDYCRWRLTDPSETEIYLDNHKRWTVDHQPPIALAVDRDVADQV